MSPEPGKDDDGRDDRSENSSDDGNGDQGHDSAGADDGEGTAAEPMAQGPLSNPFGTPDPSPGGTGPGEPTSPPGSGSDPLSDLFAGMFGGLGAGPGAGAGFQMPGLPPGMAGLPGMPTDPAALQAMLASVQQLLTSGGDGPVNWDIVRQIARQAAAEQGDPTVGEAEQRRVAEALRTAELWLDRVSDLPAAAARTEAWSRSEWIENTLDTWRGVVEPIASSVVDAMAAAMAEQSPPELRPLLSGALPMMRQLGGTFFGAQLGQALGALAGEVVGGGDVGLPLLPSGRAALIPANVASFGSGLGLPEDEVRLYLALREAAHGRLVAGVPWLRSHLLAAVEDYARGIVIDTDRIEAAVRELDINDPEALQEALASDLFQPERTPSQQAALDRLETALALVEGWVDHVVDAAARDSLPHAAALRETVRRRRAAGGPAEHTFASLVGLELRPRRLREAAAVWAELTEERGIAGRDEIWQHPDLIPSDAAFADPSGYAKAPEGATDEVDEALTRLLERPEVTEQPDGGPDAAPDDRSDDTPDDKPGPA